MSGLETLKYLMRGSRPLSGLLHTCRLSGCGTESYGVEAIIENFRALPIKASGDPVIVESAEHIALCQAEEAVFADVIEGNIARVWRIGSGNFPSTEPEVSVSFDSDLMQARPDLFFDPLVHPALAENAIEKLADIASNLVQHDRAYRARAFVLRAFGTSEMGAALIAIYRLSGEKIRMSGFTHAVVAWNGDERYGIQDHAAEAAVSEKPWTPRILT